MNTRLFIVSLLVLLACLFLAWAGWSDAQRYYQRYPEDLYQVGFWQAGVTRHKSQ